MLVVDVLAFFLLLRFFLLNHTVLMALLVFAVGSIARRGIVWSLVRENEGSRSRGGRILLVGRGLVGSIIITVSVHIHLAQGESRA